MDNSDADYTRSYLQSLLKNSCATHKKDTMTNFLIINPLRAGLALGLCYLLEEINKGLLSLPRRIAFEILSLLTYFI